MDPIYDSSSAEDIKSRRKGPSEPNEADESSEEEKSFISKLGGFLFFGCGNGNDKKKGK